MQDFIGKTAVITGAASGIGKAIALRCAQEGMQVVLAGINAANLAAAEAEIHAEAAGARALVVPTDVTRPEQVGALAERAFEAFGRVDLLVNCAGVGAGLDAWEGELSDWEWTLDVNLFGVIHALRAFVPRMLEQTGASHIVNVASVVGLLPYHPSAPYLVSKQAVIGLTEQLYYSLRQRESQVGASVLCPGFVRTRIMESTRNRPAEQAAPTGAFALPRKRLMVFARMAKDIQQGMEPAEVADKLFEGLRAGRFYILTHPELNAAIRLRMEAILNGDNPPDELDWSRSGLGAYQR